MTMILWRLGQEIFPDIDLIFGSATLQELLGVASRIDMFHESIHRVVIFPFPAVETC